ncbi:hypothetical protein [Sphingobacterium siyangense]|uniref:hypothetical protein n=1 Tax=Sphingobacterium siyangense TaxID=459529 RepID=UPI003DA6564C
MDTANNTYPALAFPASELSAFAIVIDCFIISLKNSELIHFTPDNADDFYNWLIAHNIPYIENKKTKKEEPPTANSGRSWKGLFKNQKIKH